GHLSLTDEVEGVPLDAGKLVLSPTRTYAPIIQVLKTRGYVNIESRKIIPEDRGRIVTVFLSNFFEKYVDYDFTANLENKLDDISGGRLDYINVLDDFWKSFSLSHIGMAMANDRNPRGAKAI
ncbi:MAG TPA: hypothetical protein EYQ81_00970, partial [Sneathiellales bacterium]|nr:hypothetical protein [Sneathiellales bacterium]